jgi:hypothetical protein
VGPRDPSVPLSLAISPSSVPIASRNTPQTKQKGIGKAGQPTLISPSSAHVTSSSHTRGLQSMPYILGSGARAAACAGGSLSAEGGEGCVSIVDARRWKEKARRASGSTKRRRRASTTRASLPRRRRRRRRSLHGAAPHSIADRTTHDETETTDKRNAPSDTRKRTAHTIKRTQPKHRPPARCGAQVPRPDPRVDACSCVSVRSIHLDIIGMREQVRKVLHFVLRAAPQGRRLEHRD